MLRFHFPIVIIDEDYRSENTSGLGIRALADAIKKEGMEVLGVTSYGDLSQFAQQQSRASAFILSIDDEEFTPGPELDPGGAEPAQVHRRDPLQEPGHPDLHLRRNAHQPAYAQRCAARTARLHPHVRGHAGVRGAPHHPRGQELSRRPGAAVLQGADGLRAGRLLLWHCPGHTRRRGFSEEPGGPDVPPVLRREHAARRRLQRGGRARPAARPHRPDRRRASATRRASSMPTTASSSPTAPAPSNKMVWHHTVAPGDVVVVDRNCHKSNPARHHHDRRDPGVPEAHAQPLRDHRPDSAERVQPEAIRAKIAANPLLKGMSTRPRSSLDPDA